MPLRLPLGLLLAVLLATGCSGRQLTAAPEVALALDGPPLVIMGEYEGQAFSGEMERACMVGVGRMSIRGVTAEDGLVCEAVLDEQPTEKARIRGAFRCLDGRVLYFTLRNIGPDQGVGIAREDEGNELAVLFYHPCRDEAGRRLPGAVADIEKVKRVRNTLPPQTLD